MKMLGTILQILLLTIFVPLFLALLFLMPAEFMVASWQMTTLDGKTEGQVVSSQVGHHKSGTRSEVEYAYVVDGADYRSQRISPGFLAGTGYQSGGGDLAQALHPGDRVTVYYATGHPEFSVIAFGWLKWSIGFSALVWGMLIGHQNGSWAAFTYPVGHALSTMGALCIVFFPPTLPPGDLGVLGAIFVLAVPVWILIRHLKNKTANKQVLRAPRSRP